MLVIKTISLSLKEDAVNVAGRGIWGLGVSRSLSQDGFLEVTAKRAHHAGYTSLLGPE